jgi:predicted nucleic acid-binding protein
VKVIDASSVVDVLIGAPRSAHIVHLLDDDLFAPDLLVPEVMRQLRRFVVTGHLSEAHGTDLIARMLDFPIEYLHTWPYTTTMWQWRHNIAPFDAGYVALALDLQCPLLTSDRWLAAAAHGIVPVISV